MSARRVIGIVDQVSYWSGKAAAWLIMALTFVVAIEVFKRYILNAPTAWIFDFNNMLYGTLFMMCGAYTLAAGGHVRADFVYISWRIHETSTVTAEGPPVYPFKTVIPVAGILVMLQGLAEIVRCV